MDRDERKSGPEIGSESRREAGGPHAVEAPHAALTTEVVVGDDAVAEAESRLRDAFSTGAARPVDSLIGEIENALGHGKHAWPLPVLRRLADVLLSTPDARRVSARCWAHDSAIAST